MKVEFFLFRNDKKYGPYTEDEIRALLNSEKIMLSDYIWKDGMMDWCMLSQMPEFCPDKAVKGKKTKNIKNMKKELFGAEDVEETKLSSKTMDSLNGFEDVKPPRDYTKIVVLGLIFMSGILTPFFIFRDKACNIGMIRKVVPLCSFETLIKDEFSKPYPPLKTYSYPEPKIISGSLRKLFLAKKFDKINQLLKSRNDLYKKDFRQEYNFFNAFQAFNVFGEKHLNIFNEWITEQPESYIPYLMRGMYYYNVAMAARGGDDKGRIENADHIGAYAVNIRRAEKDFDKAFELESKQLVVMVWRFKVKYLMVKKKEFVATMKLLKKEHSKSITQRWEILKYMQPKWGGSYRLMVGYTINAQKHAKENPRLANLISYPKIMSGNRYIEEDESYRAFKYLSDGIREGANAKAYLQRAKLILKQKNHDVFALIDLKRANKLNPWLTEPYNLLMKVHAKSNNLYQMKDVRDLYVKRFFTGLLVENVVDNYSSYLLDLAKTKKDDRDYKNALMMIQNVLESKPGSTVLSRAYSIKGSILSVQRNFRSAIPALIKVVEYEPTSFDPYKSLHDALMNQRRWNEAIHYWGKYIEEKPKDNRAYYSRSLVHRKNLSKKLSVADLKQACDFGHKLACKRIKKGDLW